MQHHDWLPTFLSMAGESDIVGKLKKGYKTIGRTYKNHIDGYDLTPYLTGKTKTSPRKLFVYLSDDGDVLALRYDNWKLVFMEQRCTGTMQVWAEPFTKLRVPKLFNLRTDPYEFADITSNTYLGLVRQPRLYPAAVIRSDGRVGGDLQGVLARAEAQHLHDRRRAGSDERRRRRRRTLIPDHLISSEERSRSRWRGAEGKCEDGACEGAGPPPQHRSPSDWIGSAATPGLGLGALTTSRAGQFMGHGRLLSTPPLAEEAADHA